MMSIYNSSFVLTISDLQKLYPEVNIAEEKRLNDATEVGGENG